MRMMDGSSDGCASDLVDGPHPRSGSVRVFPAAAGDTQEVRSRLDQRPAIVRRDAADGDRRHRRQLAPPGEDFRIGAARDGFRVRRKEGAERDIVGAGLARFHGEMPRILAGHAYDRIRPHRSEEQTTELQSLLRISYAVFCLNKKKKPTS